MSNKILWCDETWNPVTGCMPVSPGCEHCYARRMANRLRGRCGYPKDEPFRPGTIHLDKIEEPLRWRKHQRIFVCSMGDLFHSAVTDESLHQVWRTITLAWRHTFIVLTKRPERMRTYLTGAIPLPGVPNTLIKRPGRPDPSLWAHVWLGVTAEDQQRADERIPILLQTPAAARFVSVEPMLEATNLQGYLNPSPTGDDGACLDWVICGGESGPGARPMRPEWVRALRDQCVEAKVPFYFKQWGEYDEHGLRVGKRRAGRLLDGREWNQYPARQGDAVASPEAAR